MQGDRDYKTVPILQPHNHLTGIRRHQSINLRFSTMKSTFVLFTIGIVISLVATATSAPAYAGDNQKELIYKGDVLSDQDFRALMQTMSTMDEAAEAQIWSFLVTGGKWVVKFGPTVVKFLKTYGPKAVSFLTKYGGAFHLVNLYGKKAFDAIVKYGSKAIDAINKYGTAAFSHGKFNGAEIESEDDIYSIPDDVALHSSKQTLNADQNAEEQFFGATLGFLISTAAPLIIEYGPQVGDLIKKHGIKVIDFIKKYHAQGLKMLVKYGAEAFNKFPIDVSMQESHVDQEMKHQNTAAALLQILEAVN